MRRAALRQHSLGARTRQVCEAAALPDPPRLPLVSVLLVTRRPQSLAAALAAVARQRYPRVELILGLHGDGFPDVAPLLAGLENLARSAKVVRIDAGQPLGSALNAAVDASSGTLIAKMDDDDVYGPEHLWDLVLAHEYSQAPLVGKPMEYVYLAESHRTLQVPQGAADTFQTAPGTLAGGAVLVTRDALERAGGWRRVSVGEDGALQQAIVRGGGTIYRTHGMDFMYVRHGHAHAWDVGEEWFLSRTATVRPGWVPGLADLPDGIRPVSLSAAGT